VVLQLAIEAAGTLDKKAVREALAKMNTMTFFGPIKFGPTGQVTSLDPPVFQVQKGKQVVILPAGIKQGDLQLGVK
jgi:branched-chain amino acid transport system substrate-binding protein